MLHTKSYCVKEKGVILYLSDVPSLLLEELTFMDSHRTPKQDAVDGRILLNNSNSELHSILNTPYVKELAIERYGKVVLPNISEVLVSWFDFENANNVKLSDCLLWSDDVDGTFPQLRILPSYSKYMTTMMNSESMLIHTNGLFWFC